MTMTYREESWRTRNWCGLPFEVSHENEEIETCNSLPRFVCKIQVKEAVALPAPRENVIEDLNKVIAEANTIKTALSSSLPVSWSAEIEPECSDKNPDGSTNCLDESGRERLDPVSAAGFEMIELLILAAQSQKVILIEGFQTRV
ncbi:hypothetical protein QJS04_geneDACA001722 [Acorus gramineus]|uniref:Uncharacterized protein n=1 Tax=Acorus gramineus TaxID=55184 RepID=A0AAV9BF68_ACOGR|nr:hypothetical protein QJS04_geneDACA001722 [Acorus gramineus]